MAEEFQLKNPIQQIVENAILVEQNLSFKEIPIIKI
jgi:hypothetical protein